MLWVLKLHPSSRESGLGDGKLEGNHHSMGIGDLALELRKLRFRDVESFAEGHSACSSQSSEPRSLTPKPVFLAFYIFF